jgi:hypothetical protein
LSVRGKNAREHLGSFFKTLTKTADEVLLANQKVRFKRYEHDDKCSFIHSNIIKESDEFFERQKQFLVNYNGKIKDATNAADKVTRASKSKLDFCVVSVIVMCECHHCLSSDNSGIYQTVEQFQSSLNSRNIRPNQVND